MCSAVALSALLMQGTHHILVGAHIECTVIVPQITPLPNGTLVALKKNRRAKVNSKVPHIAKQSAKMSTAEMSAVECQSHLWMMGAYLTMKSTHKCLPRSVAHPNCASTW